MDVDQGGDGGGFNNKNGNGCGDEHDKKNGNRMIIEGQDEIIAIEPKVPELRVKQSRGRKVSEDRSSIGGRGPGSGGGFVSMNSTPVDSPEECIESMESSEHESINDENGSSTTTGRACRNPDQQQPCSSKDSALAYTQRRTCYKISDRYKLPLCRECESVNQCGKKVKNIVCRFATFRKLLSKKTKGNKGKRYVQAFGFCDPSKDPLEGDIRPWLASATTAPDGLDMELSLHLISQLGDQLCLLFQQEREMLQIKKDMGKDGDNYWKRMVDHVREMCDVCATTVFNYHWTCDNCGFMVCPGCFKARKASEELELNDNEKKGHRDPYKWLWCTKSKAHEMHKPELMSLTQIIPQIAIDGILKNLHEIREKYKITQTCGCAEIGSLGVSKESSNLAHNDENDPPLKKRKTSDSNEVVLESGSKSKLNLIQNLTTESDSKDSDSSDEEGADLLKSLVVPAGKSVVNNKMGIKSVGTSKEPDTQNGSSSSNGTKVEMQQKHAFFVRTSDNSYYAQSAIEEKIGSNIISQKKFPDLKHEWLCSGRLLNLQDPDHKDNYNLFKDLWVRGQPVIVSNVGQRLNRDLWTPEAFNKDCGDKKNDLVNCMTGKTVPAQHLSNFWEGFEDVSKRLVDDNGIPMLLKLKDWPAGEDFATFLPDRFQDLMNALPLKEYTHRTGRLNLAARLPSNFMKPDLGPKMYIAYGDGNHLDKGTTNLHLDISDAVNVMVHVAVPKNCDVDSHNKAVMEAIRTSDCDELTVMRVRQKKVIPGALWHIYRPWDADKIRDLINKVSVEKGHAIEPHHDPIHDQVVYLDKELRRRLCEEYNVYGFPIVQCEGDAVFIPAGAPHQVRNLHNCIKIAEDFVSPENVSHCFQLTEEFRNLSDSHSNHEDKLQIKNIVYHAVKDALSVVLKNVETKEEIK